MDVAVIGTGFIGSTIGNALTGAGFNIVYGSRQDGAVADPGSRTASVGDALAAAEVVVLAIPGSAVEALATEHADALAGKLVVDATNQMGEDVANARSALPKSVRYARAFNTLGGENLANPVFPDGRADLFFSAPQGDRATVESLIEGVGLRPIYVGADTEDLVDALFRLWIQLAIKQGRGRHLAIRLLED
jgi:8-hydroxy-5-deazaflavin:NADPH oxidoreductase